MRSTSSHSSFEQSPNQRYVHEHPVYTFSDYEKYCLSSGKGSGQVIRNKYIHLLTSEKQPQTTDSFFELLSNGQCECLLYTNTQFCFHLLKSKGQAIFPNEFRNKGLEFKQVNAHLGLLPSWYQSVNQVLGQFHYYTTSLAAFPYPNYITCADCSLVQRQTRPDQVPGHKCDSGKKDRYGEDSTLRYIPTFKTQDQRTIEIDITCIPLHQWDFHHLVPGIATVYEECRRLGLQTSLLQMCFQDIAFIELFAMLEHTGSIHKLGVYSMYLYIQYRLIPHLKHLRSEDIARKMFPIYTVVVTDDAAASKDLLGYDRDAVTADMCQAVTVNQDEIVSWFNKYKNVEKNKEILEQNIHPDKALQNFIADGLMTENGESVTTFVRIMNKYRPIYDGIQMFLKNSCGKSLKVSHTFTIHCENNKRLKPFGNIFGIVPSATFCPSGEIYKMLMMCSNKPYQSWLLEEPKSFYEYVCDVKPSLM